MARRPKPSKAEKLNRAIERWQAKQEGAVIMLRKSAEQLAKLHRQRRRMLKTGQTPAEARATARLDIDQIPAVQAIIAEAMPPQDDGLDIPSALDRTRKLQAMPDPRAKEKKAERKAVEKEKREAELTGKRRKMPLSGKTAMEQIREAVYGKPDRK
jgi:hypothetical protein